MKVEKDVLRGLIWDAEVKLDTDRRGVADELGISYQTLNSAVSKGAIHRMTFMKLEDLAEKKVVQKEVQKDTSSLKNFDLGEIADEIVRRGFVVTLSRK